MQTNGPAELITTAKYWQDREDPRLIAAVFDNRGLNQVTWEMHAMGAAPQFLPSRSSRTSDRPRVLDFVTDPAVPPIPPHATLDQFGSMASAVLKGDSDRVAMVRQGLRAKVQELLTHRHETGER
nr:GE004863 [Streptomyces sp.]